MILDDFVGTQTSDCGLRFRTYLRQSVTQVTLYILEFVFDSRGVFFCLRHNSSLVPYWARRGDKVSRIK
jgi:hypothetical protein